MSAVTRLCATVKIGALVLLTCTYCMACLLLQKLDRQYKLLLPKCGSSSSTIEALIYHT